jgi:hypothetical protein
LHLGERGAAGGRQARAPRPYVQLDGGVEVAGFEKPVLLLAERVELRRRLDAAERGRGNDERCDLLGRAERKVDGDAAPERVADDGRALDSERGQELFDVCDVRERATTKRRLAEAA